MGDSRYQQDQRVWPPAPGNGQQDRAGQEADAPDFIMEAARQLRLVTRGIDSRAKSLRETGQQDSDPEWDPGVREARLAVADRLIALAEIQYAIPGEEDYGDE